MDAVIDKDLASAVLAKEVGAQFLSILTSINQVAINFGNPDEKKLDMITVSEAKKYLDEGHFAPGSMEPKIQAAISFLENGGEMVTISSLEEARKALRGEAGTRIVRD